MLRRSERFLPGRRENKRMSLFLQQAAHEFLIDAVVLGDEQMKSATRRRTARFAWLGGNGDLFAARVRERGTDRGQ